MEPTPIPTTLMCKNCFCPGIQGYNTNHSLRATAATRLYLSGIDEQRTRHHSRGNSFVQAYNNGAEGGCFRYTQQYQKAEKPAILISWPHAITTVTPQTYLYQLICQSLVLFTLVHAQTWTSTSTLLQCSYIFGGRGGGCPSKANTLQLERKNTIGIKDELIKSNDEQGSNERPLYEGKTSGKVADDK